MEPPFSECIALLKNRVTFKLLIYFIFDCCIFRNYKDLNWELAKLDLHLKQNYAIKSMLYKLQNKIKFYSLCYANKKIIEHGDILVAIAGQSNCNNILLESIYPEKANTFCNA